MMVRQLESVPNHIILPPPQFKQIAQAVHVRFPRTTSELAELPAPTNGTTVEIKETKIAEINEDEGSKMEEESNKSPEEKQQDAEKGKVEEDGDLV